MIYLTFTNHEILIIKRKKMKKILLTIALCSTLPAIAVAENKSMQNTHTSASDVDMTKGKHMRNTHTSKSDINMAKKNHMKMGDNPFSEHDKAKKKKVKNQKYEGWSVVPYSK